MGCGVAAGFFADGFVGGAGGGGRGGGCDGDGGEGGNGSGVAVVPEVVESGFWVLEEGCGRVEEGRRRRRH